MAKKTSSSKSEEKPSKTPKASATPASAKAPSAKEKSAAPAKRAAGTSSKTPTTKAGKKPAAAGTAAPASPMIDTSLAAQAAAAMVLHRGTAATAASGAAQKESASFKAFKQNVNKPSGVGGLLGGGLSQKKGGSNLPFGGGKQVGHNQTFGADVARTGVPRRTSG